MGQRRSRNEFTGFEPYRTRPKSQKLLNPDSTKKAFESRSYTIRFFRPGDLELDIDFLLHGDSGPASKWANSAQIGEIISVGS